jgi:DNA-binding response OmpR family regulator
VTALADTVPDVLILDSQGVAEQGSEAFLRELRAQPHLATLPIILCTGALAYAETMAPVLAALHVAVLIKPFDIDQLLAAVDVPPAVGA